MSSAAVGRCDGQGRGGDLLVMKRNEESPLPKNRKRSREAGPPPASTPPPAPSPRFLHGARVFDFLAPVPLGAGIIPIQAHTEHCKLISLGYSHRKSGCQILFPPQFLNFLSPPRARGLAPGLSV